VSVYRPVSATGSFSPHAFGGSASTFDGARSEVAAPARVFGAATPELPEASAPRSFGATGGPAPPQRSASGRAFTFRGHAERPFAAARYNWPRGQIYRRYRLGMYLPPIFWLSDALSLDYVDYGLAVPPVDCAWVRYGPDMLLVNRVTGQVIDVVYDAFVEGPPVAPVPTDGPEPAGPPLAQPNG
jgi:Ni/Co efflux regulator RcnB